MLFETHFKRKFSFTLNHAARILGYLRGVVGYFGGIIRHSIGCSRVNGLFIYLLSPRSPEHHRSLELYLRAASALRNPRGRISTQTLLFSKFLVDAQGCGSNRLIDSRSPAKLLDIASAVVTILYVLNLFNFWTKCVFWFSKLHTAEERFKSQSVRVSAAHLPN